MGDPLLNKTGLHIFLCGLKSAKYGMGHDKRISFICYLPSGRSVLGKTVPEVLSLARGLRTANNVFIFFCEIAVKGPKMFVT